MSIVQHGVTGVILDLDGVLLDSLANMRAAWEEIPAPTRRHIAFDEFSRFIGLPFDVAMAHLGLKSFSSELEMRYRANSKKHSELLESYAGVSGVLSRLREQKFSVTLFTSKDCDRVTMICDRFGWEFSNTLCPRDDIPGKPSGAQLKKMFLETGTEPSQHLYFGDSDFDYEAALDADVPYWHCRWGFGVAPAKLLSTRAISNPSQILEVMMMPSS